jgi:hypothetical protein
LLKHIQNRDIVFYSFNTEENSLLWKLWLNGEVNFSEKLDFNYPVYTSIWWNKTDRYIQYRYDKFVEQLPWTCDFKTSLIVYKAHHFSKYEEERVSNLLDDYWVKNKRDILNIQGKGDNKSYVRILIPKNTIVQTAKNQNVYDYWNYKILELYITTQNLETSKTTISYTISNPDCQKYTYKFFKQPWIRKYNINFNVFWEENKYNEIENDFIYKRDEQ